jgi:hypothetical protein
MENLVRFHLNFGYRLWASGKMEILLEANRREPQNYAPLIFYQQKYKQNRFYEKISANEIGDEDFAAEVVAWLQPALRAAQHLLSRQLTLLFDRVAGSNWSPPEAFWFEFSLGLRFSNDEDFENFILEEGNLALASAQISDYGSWHLNELWVVDPDEEYLGFAPPVEPESAAILHTFFEGNSGLLISLGECFDPKHQSVRREALSVLRRRG